MSTNEKAKSSTPLQYKASKDKYEKTTRRSKPVSFNRVTEKRILDVADTFNFSNWVKNLLGALTPAEVSVMKGNKDPHFIPVLLIEKAIEDGLFSLEEYLESQGKKIVDIASDAEPKYDESCQLTGFEDNY